MKVLIADDHALFRDGLGMRLEQIDPNVVILQASSFGQALKILDQEKKIDLVVLDLDMPDMPWEEGLGEMRKKAECARFVVVSASEDVRNIRKVLESGVCGYIPKRSSDITLKSSPKRAFFLIAFAKCCIISTHHTTGWAAVASPVVGCTGGKTFIAAPLRISDTAIIIFSISGFA